MKALYDVPAPAKLNLFLHITGRRADGYHLLQSVFMLIDWCDTLHFELRPTASSAGKTSGHRPCPRRPGAARRAGSASGHRLPMGAHIGVDKRIPAQAGMGGGSSDAATCLLALNRLWKLNLPLWRNSGRSACAGRRRAIFPVRGHNAWVEGIGEKITRSRCRLPLCRGQTTRGIGNPSAFFGPGAETRHQNCYNLRLCCKPYGFGSQRPAAVAQRLCARGQPRVWSGLQSLGWQAG
jgi:4-diphosphocytidyl-2-C-methyl-D-erythritol kinase